MSRDELLSWLNARVGRPLHVETRGYAPGSDQITAKITGEGVLRHENGRYTIDRWDLDAITDLDDARLSRAVREDAAIRVRVSPTTEIYIADTTSADA